MFLVAE